MIKIDDDLKNLPQSTAVRATMLKSIIDNLDALGKNPDFPPKLLLQISGAYVQAGIVQGLRTGEPNVGHDEEALHSMEKAVQIAERVAAKGSSDPVLPRVRFTAHYNLGQMQWVSFTSPLQTIERPSRFWSRSTPDLLSARSTLWARTTTLWAGLSRRRVRSRPRLTLIAPRQRFVRALSSNIRPIWVTRDGS